MCDLGGLVGHDRLWIWDFPGHPVLRLCASTAGGEGSIPGWGTKILHASQNNKEKVLSVRGAGEGVEVQAWHIPICIYILKCSLWLPCGVEAGRPVRNSVLQ